MDFKIYDFIKDEFDNYYQIYDIDNILYRQTNEIKLKTINIDKEFVNFSFDNIKEFDELYTHILVDDMDESVKEKFRKIFIYLKVKEKFNNMNYSQMCEYIKNYYVNNTGKTFNLINFFEHKYVKDRIRWIQKYNNNYNLNKLIDKITKKEYNATNLDFNNLVDMLK